MATYYTQAAHTRLLPSEINYKKQKKVNNTVETDVATPLIPQ